VSAEDPTGWFEPLYAKGAREGTPPPWGDEGAPNPVLAAWLDERGIDGGDGARTAAVVGVGLSGDAEHLAARGFATLGFDVSPTAVRVARERSTQPRARYEVGDLLALPSQWRGAFDLVAELWTVQALPVAVREQATAAIASLVAPGGTLLAGGHVPPGGEDRAAAPEDGPPWLLTRAEMERFGAPPLRTVALDVVRVPSSDYAFWRGEYARERDR
jgi:Methyltransferase domain